MASIQRLPSGKWRALIRKAGVTKSSTFIRKADATAWAAGIESSISSATGTVRAPAGMTLARVISAYLDQVPAGKTTTANLKRIAADKIGTIGVGSLNALHLSEFVAQRQRDGIAGSTLAGDLSALSGVLRWARRVKQIDLNERLAAEARSSLSAARIDTRSAERTRLPTEDELQRIIAYFEANDRMQIDMPTIIRFAAVSAMRLGEIVAIRYADISWNRAAVLIRERKDPKRKARNDQLVPMPPEAMAILHTAAQGRAQGHLFPYEAQSVSTAWRRACKALQIKDLHFHDLRHLGITNLFRLGLDVPTVAQVSGHKDWKHLKRYTNLAPEDFHNAFARASDNT
jgi:integrase